MTMRRSPASRAGRLKDGSILMTLLAWVALTIAGCAPRHPAQTGPYAAAGERTPPPVASPQGRAGHVPTELTEVGEHAEDMYDTVRARNWTKAGADLGWFETGLTNAQGAVLESGGDTRPLKGAVDALGKAIAARSRRTSLIEANRITHLVAGLTAAFEPAVPVAVTELDYQGRQLEIWSEAKDAAKLRATAAEMRGTWDGLRLEVEARGGTAEAEEFGALIQQVEAAKAPEDFARLATPILDQVDAIETVFSR